MNSGLSDIKNPFFSIIIPVFNAAEALRASIAEIQKQSFQEFEIVVVDGASADGTAQLLASLQSQHQNIRYVSEPDKGIYDAMNKGAQLSTGRYLYFVGVDDFFLDLQVLDGVYQNLKQTGFPEFFYGNVLLGNTNIVHNGEYNLLKLFTNNICHQSIFYSKTVFDKVGTFDLSFPALSDWHFNFRCFARTDISRHYQNSVIARYGLGGFSSRTKDPLTANKETIFLELASNASAWEYYNLRKNIIDVSTLKGKASYVFYYLSFIVVDVWSRIKKRRS
jgi:glycosyltransferase involved in cell wall biosynthesis